MIDERLVGWNDENLRKLQGRRYQKISILCTICPNLIFQKLSIHTPPNLTCRLYMLKMAMNLSDKSITTVESEMEVEETSFLWKIKNFGEVIRSDSLINWQRTDFHMGDTISLSSDWTVYLQCLKDDGNGGRWVGIFYKMKEKPSTSCTELLVHCHVAIKNKDGTTVWNGKPFVKDALLMPSGWGYPKMIKDDSTLPYLVDGSLVIHLNFKIYSRPQSNHSIEEALQDFQTKAGAKAWSDIKDALKNPASCNQLTKLVSSDAEEFTAQKAVLGGSNYESSKRTRNPVFKAILESNMKEATSGVIRLPNISSPTLKVLLHFLCQGELPPDWSHPEVIVELTNAAAQYQIDDLLAFLDSTLGRVCTLENVVELLGLATQLSLNTAKEDLMRYVRQKGFGSLDNLVEFLESAGGSSSKKRSLVYGDEGNGTAGKKAKTNK